MNHSITFLPLKEFKQWKHDEETQTNSHYTQQSGSRIRINYKQYCNRSGKYQTRGTERRSLKLQGTNQIYRRFLHCTYESNSTTKWRS